VLRAISFGKIQSGIANRLRRGGGGATIAERARCADAEAYEAFLDRAEKLAEHVDRMIRIAAALRMDAGAIDQDSRLKSLLSEAEADMARVRRAGFDVERAALADAFAHVDETLVRVRDETTAFTAAVSSVARRQPLPQRFEHDRALFAATLTKAYGEESSPDDHFPAHSTR